MDKPSESLIKKAQAGDRRALNRLFTSWYQPVYGIAYRYFGDADTAREISQQAFLTVQEKLPGLADPGSFKVWLYRTVINLCHLQVRSTQTRQRNHDGFGYLRSRDKTPDPEEIYHRQERTQLVLTALQQLPPEQRTVLIMKEYEELKFREIADILDLPENTVKSRLYYGLKALRKFFIANNLKKEFYHE